MMDAMVKHERPMRSRMMDDMVKHERPMRSKMMDAHGVHNTMLLTKNSGIKIGVNNTTDKALKAQISNR